MVELVDRRVLGAVRLLDGVTDTPVRRPMTVEGTGLRFYRNRIGLYVIVGADGFDKEYLSRFEDPPANPSAGSLPFVVEVHDPVHAYLPVLASISLPLPFDPENDIRDLQQPVDIALASSAARSTPLTWANLRVLVLDTADAPIRGALVDAAPAGGGDRIGWGITNHNGEALVPVPGLPAMREIENDPLDAEDNEIVTAETSVTVTATADPELPWPVNPVTLAAGGGALRTASVSPVALQPGRTDTAPTLVVDLT